MISAKELPKQGTQEYYDLIKYVCELMEEYLFMSVYGFTNYDLGYHWTDKEVNTYGSRIPCSIHIKTAIKLLNKLNIALDLSDYLDKPERN